MAPPSEQPLWVKILLNICDMRSVGVGLASLGVLSAVVGLGFLTWDYSVCRPGTVSECWSVCKKEITVGLATGIFWASGPGCDLVWKAYRGKGTGSYGY